MVSFGSDEELSAGSRSSMLLGEIVYSPVKMADDDKVHFVSRTGSKGKGPSVDDCAVRGCNTPGEDIWSSRYMSARDAGCTATSFALFVVNNWRS